MVITRRILPALVFCAMSGFQIGSAVAQATPPTATPPPIRITTDAIPFDDTTPEAVLVLLEVDPGWKPGDTPKLMAVAHGDDREAPLLGAFSVAWNKTVGAPLLAIRPDRSALHEAGAYTLTVRVTATKNQVPDQTVDLVVRLTRAAPVLRAPAAISIELEDLPWPFGTSWSQPRLAIDETSGKAGITGLDLWQATAFAQDGKAVAGSLEFSTDPTIVPNGATAATIADIPNVPLGASTSTFEVRTDQIRPPARITVDVRRHRWTWWVAIVFLIGGVLGAIVRTWSQKITTEASALGNADDAIARLDDSAAKSSLDDAATLDQRIAEIKRAAAAGDPAAVTAAIAAAEAALASVLTRNQAALEGLRGRVDGFARVENLAHLPPDVKAVFDVPPLSAAINAASAALRTGDVRTATATCDAIDKRIRGAGDAATTWIDGLGVQLARVVDAQGKPIDAVYVGVKPAWKRFADRRAQIVADAGLAGVELLVAVDGHAAGLARDVVLAANELAALATEADQKLAKNRNVAALIVNACKVTPSAEPVADLGRVIDAVLAIQGTMEKATGGDATVAAQVAQGDYGAAWALIEKLVAMGGTPPVVTLPGPFAELAREAVPVGRPPATVATLLTPEMRARDRLARWIRIGFAYVALPLAAWYLYGPSFVGGGREMLVLLATGFFTDFTFDAAIDAFGKLRKPTAD